MKKLLMRSVLILLGLISFFANAQSKKGTLKGKVLSAEGTPAAYVPVGLKDTKYGAVTDENGFYTIKAPAGSYALTVQFVGHEVEEKQVEIKEEETTTVEDFTLRENAKELQEVTVQGQAVASTASRMPLSLIETPQSIQVISEKVLKDQQAFTLSEGVKNIAGVSLHNGGQYNDLVMRGFRTSDGNFAYNGQRGSLNDSYSPQNLFNVERLEAVKGPASIYFGAANPGGVINIVTKKPQEKKGYAVDYTFGSWNTHRISADATGAITSNKKFLYRAIVGYQSNESFRDFVGQKTLFIAPSITYRPTEKTSINLEYNFMNRDEKGGGYYERGIITPDPKNLFVLPISWSGHEPNDKSNERNHSVQLNITHQFNKHISITTLNRYLSNKANQHYHHLNWGSLDNADGVNDTVTRHYREYPWTTQSFISNTYASFKFNLGPVKNTVVTGVDYGTHKINFLETAPHYNMRGVGIAPLNIYHPVYGQSNPDNYTGYEFWGGLTTNQQYFGGYIQNFIEFSPRLKAMLGIRYDTYSNKTESEYTTYENAGGYVYDPANVTKDTSTASAFVPRIGLIYMPVENISLYGSYVESFLPQTSNQPKAGGPFPPERGMQYEAGIKGEFFNKKFVPTIAVYQIYNRNLLTRDPTNSERQLVNGLAGSKGVEVTAQGEVAKNLFLLANYSYNEAKTLKDKDGKEGSLWFDNAPNHLGSVWITYGFSKGILNGVKIGGGAYHVGNRNVSSDPDLLFPAYTTLDFMVGYTWKMVSFNANFNNVTDERYITGGWDRYLMSPGAPFNFKGSIGVRF